MGDGMMDIGLRELKMSLEEYSLVGFLRLS